MKIQWQGCHPFEACSLVSSEMTDKQMVEWWMCRRKDPSHSCATTEVLRLTSWERILGRKCQPSRQGEGSSRMRDQQNDWEEQSSGNPQEWALYKRKPRKVAVPLLPPIWKQSVPPWSHMPCLWSDGVENRAETLFLGFWDLNLDPKIFSSLHQDHHMQSNHNDLWIPLQAPVSWSTNKGRKLRFALAEFCHFASCWQDPTLWSLTQAGKQRRKQNQPLLRCLFQQALSFNLRSGSQHSPGKEPRAP